MDLTTEHVLASMLRENTGTHMLDSGGYYGRHWQQNQGRDDSAFEKQPHQKIEAYVSNGQLDVCYSRNLYHFLKEALDFDARMQRIFEHYCRITDEENRESWHTLKNEFPFWLRKKLAKKNKLVTGIYGDGDPCVTNTYNYDSSLDQVIEYSYFEIHDKTHRHYCENAYVVLQIHGGCDVRGGYTAPKVFTLSEELSIMNDRDGYLCCEDNDDHRWSTDDGGYHWHYDGWPLPDGFESNYDLDLKGFPAKEVADDKKVKTKFTGSLGFVQVKNHAVYCPICGGRLS